MSLTVSLEGTSNNFFKNLKTDSQCKIFFDKNKAIWQQHKKFEISFIQNQNAKLLTSLHNELERLQNLNRGSLF